MASYKKDECPVCGCNRYKQIGAVKEGNPPVPVADGSAIVKCTGCRLIYVNPMPYWSEEDFPKLYDSTYFTYLHDDEQKEWLDIRQSVNPRIRYGIVQKQLKTDNRKLLEIGAGECAFMCRYLKDKGWDITVQEPAEAYHDELIKTFGQDVRIEKRGVLELDGEGEYALIYADSVLEHVPDPILYYQKIARLLAPGGVLYTISPNEYSLDNFIKNAISKIKGKQPPYIAPYRDPYHLLGFTKKSLSVLAEKSGLTLVCYKRFNDRKALHMRKSKRNPLIKYPVALCFAIADKLGMGTNAEAVLIKKP